MSVRVAAPLPGRGDGDPRGARPGVGGHRACRVTSVEGLAAKDVIDLDLTVADPRDARYEDAKRAAVPGGGHVMDYNARKQETVRAIYDRLLRAAGML